MEACRALQLITLVRTARSSADEWTAEDRAIVFDSNVHGCVSLCAHDCVDGVIMYAASAARDEQDRRFGQPHYGHDYHEQTQIQFAPATDPPRAC